ncbi:g6932 [Coccomyxa elongata]
MLQSYACTSIMMFCNNLAFQQGTNNRMSKNFRRAMDTLPSVKFTIISTTPLVALEDRLHITIPLDMTWAPAHMSQVYVWHGIHDAKAGVAA